MELDWNLRCFNEANTIGFCTPYIGFYSPDDPSAENYLLHDLAHTLADCGCAIVDFFESFKDFMLVSYPLVLLFLALNSPLLLALSLPIATQLLAYNTLFMAIAVFMAAPSVISLAHTLLHFCDILLSPALDLLAITSNLLATAVANMPSVDCFEFSFG